MTTKIAQKTVFIISSRYSNFIVGFFVLCCLMVYVYFANSTVRTVTMLEKTKKEIQLTNVRVSDLESRRLLADNNLNLENAKSLGFVKVKNQTFIINKNVKTAYSN